MVGHFSRDSGEGISFSIDKKFANVRENVKFRPKMQAEKRDRTTSNIVVVVREFNFTCWLDDETTFVPLLGDYMFFKCYKIFIDIYN